MIPLRIQVRPVVVPVEDEPLPTLPPPPPDPDPQPPDNHEASVPPEDLFANAAVPLYVLQKLGHFFGLAPFSVNFCGASGKYRTTFSIYQLVRLLSIFVMLARYS